MASNQVFISYSHKDKKFLEQLLIHLKPLEREAKLKAWSDQQITPGSEWFDEIQEALSNATVAVLLVTPAFLASDFINDHELGPILKKAKEGGVVILWVPVRASSYKETSLVNCQAVISPDKPVAEMKAERDKAWVRICSEIKKAINHTGDTLRCPDVTRVGQTKIAATAHNPFLETPDQFEDGTNILAGTPYIEEFSSRVLPWYVPGEAKGNRNWKVNFKKLKSRFEKLRDKYCPIQCGLVQRLIPEYASGIPEGYGNPDPQFRFSGSQLSREPVKLCSPDGEPLIGVFPIKSIQGTPILESNRQPIAYRYGLRRYCSVYCAPDGFRQAPPPLAEEIMDDGGNFLYQLPSGIALSIWRNWASGFSQNQNKEKWLWLNAMFEISWQSEHGSPFFIRRYARVKNISIELFGNGLFPRLPDHITAHVGTDISHENGYPWEYYAEIPDVTRASLTAIDEILDHEGA